MTGAATFSVGVALSEAATQPAKPAPRRGGLRGVRILVVDDIGPNRNIFGRQLEAEGASSARRTAARRP